MTFRPKEKVKRNNTIAIEGSDINCNSKLTTTFENNISLLNYIIQDFNNFSHHITN